MPAIVASWRWNARCCALAGEAGTVIAAATDIATRYRTVVLLLRRRGSKSPSPALLAWRGREKRRAASMRRQIEIPVLVVGGRAEPHPSLVVHEEVAQRILGVGERIFDDLSGI